MLFCVGDFFGNDNNEWQQVISGALKGMQYLAHKQYALSDISCMDMHLGRLSTHL